GRCGHREVGGRAEIDHLGHGSAQNAALPRWALGRQVDLLRPDRELKPGALAHHPVLYRHDDLLVRADPDDGEVTVEPGDGAGEQVGRADEAGHEPGPGVLVDLAGRPEVLDAPV